MTFKSPYASRIKIFLDGADRATLVEMAGSPLVQGFTTNPTLIKKAGVRDYKAFCLDILGQLQGKPVSFEVFADDFSEMLRQGREIAKWEKPGTQVYVKVPIMNSKGESTIPVIRELSHAGVKLNITAVYAYRQVWEICEAVKGGAPSIVSIFAGRIADTGRDPLPLMQAAVEICGEAGKQVELLWASTREAWNIVQAEMIGCHIITAPADVIKRVPSFRQNRELHDLSLDTVKIFKADCDAAGFTL